MWIELEMRNVNIEINLYLNFSVLSKEAFSQSKCGQEKGERMGGNKAS